MKRYWYKKNKTQLLRGFCAVIETGSTIKAAAMLNIASSSISLQIASLERDLDLKLFRRERQKLIPNKEGLKFYKLCKKIVDEIDFVFENAKQIIKEDFDDKITISAHFYMLSHILPPYFKKMIEKNPNVQFELYNSSYSEGLELLNSGNIDFAIFPVNKHEELKNVKVYEFYKCTFGLITHKDHPLVNTPESELNWDKISNYDYITLGKNITGQGLKSHLETNGVDSRFKLNNGTWEICLGLIKENITISGADVKYAENQQDIVFTNCNTLLPEYQFHVLVNKSFSMSKAAKDLLKILGIKQPLKTLKG